MEKTGTKIRRGQSNQSNKGEDGGPRGSRLDEGRDKIDFKNDDVQFPSEDTSSSMSMYKSHGTDESENIRLNLCAYFRKHVSIY
jgi:hypothetical protein